ncbi:MAG: hypothetical protein OEY80_02495 [Nitrospirota bacterium]|nr:hypothetical protein [Nitrospirota bacterium]
MVSVFSPGIIERPDVRFEVFEFTDDGLEVRVDLLKSGAADGLTEGMISFMDDLVHFLNAPKDGLDARIVALVRAVCPDHVNGIGGNLVGKRLKGRGDQCEGSLGPVREGVGGHEQVGHRIRTIPPGHTPDDLHKA